MQLKRIQSIIFNSWIFPFHCTKAHLSYAEADGGNDQQTRHEEHKTISRFALLWVLLAFLVFSSRFHVARTAVGGAFYMARISVRKYIGTRNSKINRRENAIVPYVTLLVSQSKWRSVGRSFVRFFLSFVWRFPLNCTPAHTHALPLRAEPKARWVGARGVHVWRRQTMNADWRSLWKMHEIFFFRFCVSQQN